MKKNMLNDIKQHLMTGTSFMIPFVVAGGILFALSVMLSGEAAVPEAGWLAGLNQIGAAGLALFIPALGGYIAFSMADKPGIAPGFIGAYLAREVGATAARLAHGSAVVPYRFRSLFKRDRHIVIELYRTERPAVCAVAVSNESDHVGTIHKIHAAQVYLCPCSRGSAGKRRHLLPLQLRDRCRRP